MIFVVLGTQKFQLNRLLKIIDDYVAKGFIQEEVIAQIGNSDYKPINFKYNLFLDKKDFDHYIAEASLVITHSGVGSIITALNARKPVIVFPRLAKYQEHVDNHQLDIANSFHQKKYVLCCQDEENLLDIINKSRSFPFESFVSGTHRIVEIIDNYLGRIP